jgi:hypothetical protein
MTLAATNLQSCPFFIATGINEFLDNLILVLFFHIQIYLSDINHLMSQYSLISIIAKRYIFGT